MRKGFILPNIEEGVEYLAGCSPEVNLNARLYTLPEADGGLEGSVLRVKDSKDSRKRRLLASSRLRRDIGFKGINLYLWNSSHDADKLGQDRLNQSGFNRYCNVGGLQPDGSVILGRLLGQGNSSPIVGGSWGISASL